MSGVLRFLDSPVENDPDNGLLLDSSLDGETITITGNRTVLPAVLTALLMIAVGANTDWNVATYGYALFLVVGAIAGTFQTVVEFGPRSLRLRRRLFNRTISEDVLAYDGMAAVAPVKGVQIKMRDGRSVRIRRGNARDHAEIAGRLQHRLSAGDGPAEAPEALQRLRGVEAIQRPS